MFQAAFYIIDSLLDSIDLSLKLFSKPKVYIKNTDPFSLSSRLIFYETLD